MTFDEWCAALNKLAAAEPHRYGPDAVANCGADAWRGYYDVGATPAQAWAEDGFYVE